MKQNNLNKLTKLSISQYIIYSNQTYSQHTATLCACEYIDETMEI